MVCKTCGSLTYSGTGHVCPPAWWAWDAEVEDPEPEEKQKVHAWTAQAAAERWAELYDDGEVSIAYGDDKTVCVEPVAGGAVERFDVSGYMTPVYNARPHVPPTPWTAGDPVMVDGDGVPIVDR
jgi:hypothetical protein